MRISKENNAILTFKMSSKTDDFFFPVLNIEKAASFGIKFVTVFY
jgi:hypothetical protein